MGKIIITNKTSLSDLVATEMVCRVIAKGFISGEKQYCWLTHFESLNGIVVARKTNGDTHSFTVEYP